MIISQLTKESKKIITTIKNMTTTIHTMTGQIKDTRTKKITSSTLIEILTNQVMIINQIMIFTSMETTKENQGNLKKSKIPIAVTMTTHISKKSMTSITKTNKNQK